ncbi:MAG: SDR family NAD(P)-dependent oxidoreductase [Labilithrix sp.]|nr:SDR family NAD(P)-dependent oxidoreductase [Labilithrix sp.]
MPEGIADLRGKDVVVTGAASGIGRATAEALAREGARLYLCDVDSAGLAEAAAAIGRAVTLTREVDVSKRDAVEAFAADVHASSGKAVDVLVNNAGVGLAGGILDTTLEDWEWVLSVNLWGVVHGCHYFLPRMVAEGRGGHVVNVASALGLFAAPNVVGYSASKFAVVGLSESMRAELAAHRVGVTTICPGVIDTNIVKTARFRQKDAVSARDRVVAMYKKRAYSPERVADAVVRSIKLGRGVVPVTVEAWLAYYVKRFAPGLVDPMSRALSRRAIGG